MKEVIVRVGPKCELKDSPIPSPGPGQITIKVYAAAANPKDWKLAEWFEGRALNEGEDMSGTVHAIGEGVSGFSIGDRVAALHDNATPHGAYAEYAVAWAFTTFRIPASVTYEEASTFPLAIETAAWALWRDLVLPTPWTPVSGEDRVPLVINGGSTAVGAFAIKLASLANIHPIVTTAGSGKAFVETLLDKEKGDICIDYRAGKDETVAAIKKALHGQQCKHSIDAVGDLAGHDLLQAIMSPDGTISLSLPVQPTDSSSLVAKTVVMSSVSIFETYAPSPPGGQAFGVMFTKYVEYAIGKGLLKGHPYEVIPGGLLGVQTALDNLKAGKVSASKYVLRVISDA
ncbi:GroES-like protein [Polychaeton citri CBS 116435]|uniref:GroES-like protein n=1 Tax=Polychaeton citri CBS 116435 TaxID=1314669 RepID=A0A9P4Q0I0_9PEZI|nr:GroES-like protein [Polychaeton citri CBS 116435]